MSVLYSCVCVTGGREEDAANVESTVPVTHEMLDRQTTRRCAIHARCGTR